MRLRLRLRFGFDGFGFGVVEEFDFAGVGGEFAASLIEFGHELEETLGVWIVLIRDVDVTAWALRCETALGACMFVNFPSVHLLLAAFPGMRTWNGFEAAFVSHMRHNIAIFQDLLATLLAVRTAELHVVEDVPKNILCAYIKTGLTRSNEGLATRHFGQSFCFFIHPSMQARQNNSEHLLYRRSCFILHTHCVGFSTRFRHIEHPKWPACVPVAKVKPNGLVAGCICFDFSMLLSDLPSLYVGGASIDER